MKKNWKPLEGRVAAMYIYRQGTLGWFIEIALITGSLPYKCNTTITRDMGASLRRLGASPLRDQYKRA